MRNRLKDFIRNTDGAVTVDWVVLAAAVVGLGVTSVNVVRSGSNALAGDIQTSLSNASVALVCQGGNPSAGDYQLVVLVGDNAASADYHRDYYSRVDDATLLESYQSQIRKIEDIRREGAEVELADQVDYLALMAREIDERGRDLDRDVPGFSEVHASIYGASGGCGGDGSGSGAEAGHELAYYSDPRLQDDYRAAQEEFRNHETGALHDTVRKIDEQFHEAINNGSLQDAAKLLDLAYMAYQEAQTRDDERLILDAQARYERAYATWLETRR